MSDSPTAEQHIQPQPVPTTFQFSAITAVNGTRMCAMQVFSPTGMFVVFIPEEIEQAVRNGIAGCFSGIQVVQPGQSPFL